MRKSLTACFFLIFMLMSCSSQSNSKGSDSNLFPDTENNNDDNDQSVLPDNETVQDEDTAAVADIDILADDADNEMDDSSDNIATIDDESQKICEPGAVECSTDELKRFICDENGLEWITEDCVEDHYCDSQSKTCEPMYIVSLNNNGDKTALIKINVITGIGAELCSVTNADAGTSYNSSTFSRDSILYLSNSGMGRLDRMNPNTCEITVVGSTGFKSIPGITSDRANGIFGIANKTNDEGKKNKLVSIDILTGLATVVGDLGFDFGTSGATWSEELESVYAINGLTDKLYLVDTDTGLAAFIIDLTDSEGKPFDFGSVGIEMHPMNGKIYACSDKMPLLQVDPETGTVKEIGTGIYGSFGCNNLAAPWKDVVDDW